MKSKSHIFMANLLREYILSQSGKVNIDGHVFYIPEDALYAIENYPSYFRGGSVGPDFFPDMVFGQSKMHPEKSGKWLKRMELVLSRMSKHSMDYYPSYAFYLGYLMHYATDLFGHEDVNYYAGGYFPDIEGIITNIFKSDDNGNKASNDIKIIGRHILIETYMDSKLSKTEPVDIDVPLGFIRNVFATLEAWEYMDDESTGLFNILPCLVAKYQAALNKCSQGKYVRYAEKREEYITGWLNIWVTFTKISVKSTISDALDATQDAMENYLINYFAELADLDGTVNTVEFIFSLFSDTAEVLMGVLTLGASYTLSAFKEALSQLFKTIFLTCLLNGILRNLGMKPKKGIEAKKKQLKDFFEIPKNALRFEPFFKDHTDKVRKFYNDSDNFKKFCKENGRKKNDLFLYDYLDYQWGNFGKSRDIFKQDYKVFSRCLKMGLLCLIGANNMNKLFYDVSLAELEPKDYPSKGLDYKYGVSKIEVVARMAKGDSGTNNDVFLDLGDSRDAYRFLLDHGGIDDFENREKYHDGIYRHDIQLPHFLPANCISYANIHVSGSDYVEFDSVTVLDKDTGIVLASSGNFNCKDKRRDHNLQVPSNLEDEFKNANVSKERFGFNKSGGFYLLFDRSNGNNCTLELVLHTKGGGKYSLTKFITRKKECLYFPFFISLNAIASIEYKVDTRWTKFNKLFLYEATNHFLFASCIGPISNTKYHSFDLVGYRAKDYIFRGSKMASKEFYLIVKTAASFAAGTNDDFTFNTYKKDREKPFATPLSAAKDLFECNQYDVFNISLDETMLKDITRFELYKKPISSLGDWTMDYIALVDAKTGFTLFYYKGAGPTVIENDFTIDINFGYWKCCQDILK